MIVNGIGITEFYLRVKPDFKPLTRLAIEWRKKADGNYAGTDRGASYDSYEADITTYGTESYLNNVITQLEANRAAENHVLTLTSFGSNEKIFGEDVASTSVSATVVGFNPRSQGSWKGWGLSLRLRALSPTFTGTASLPTLAHCDFGVDADRNFTINKIDSYNGSFEYLDHGADAGTFTGVFTLTAANMANLRRYIATQRTGNFALANNFGIAYPFGVRSGRSYPFETKLIEFQDLGVFGVVYRKVKLKFAEVV